jgi:hypothetical protein
LGKDFEEAFVETQQSTAGFLITRLAAVHFQEVTSCRQCLADAREAGARHVFGKRECGDMMQMRCILTSLAEFAL